ncbi:hypothetical protein ACKGJY_10910 [Hyunsoonleella sp. 2307UL5-6]|uniref:hypothetical protein n=1 Tax=Hyunsoonleella sp. 2307UL5-6 TaxID=3384768 RepID=UPI0039BCACE0
MKFFKTIITLSMVLAFFSCKENKAKTQKDSTESITTKSEELYVQEEFFFEKEINKKLGDNFFIKSFGILYGENENDYKLVFVLSDFATKTSVNQYSFGMQVFLPQEEREKLKLKKPYIDWNFNPDLESNRLINYISLDRKTTIRSIDSIRCYSYKRDKYEGAIGTFWVKGIEL